MQKKEVRKKMLEQGICPQCKKKLIWINGLTKKRVRPRVKYRFLYYQFCRYGCKGIFHHNKYKVTPKEFAKQWDAFNKGEIKQKELI